MTEQLKLDLAGTNATPIIVPQEKTDADRTFGERNAAGRINRAEEVFMDLAKEHGWLVIKLGFDEKKGQINSARFNKIPALIRAAPDYIVVGTKAVFVEVKGYRGQLKIKQADLSAYAVWSLFGMEVKIFAHDCDNDISYLLGWRWLNDRICSKHSTVGFFDEDRGPGKKYHTIPIPPGGVRGELNLYGC